MYRWRVVLGICVILYIPAYIVYTQRRYFVTTDIPSVSNLTVVKVLPDNSKTFDTESVSDRLRDDVDVLWMPRVHIGVLVYNKAHSLPYFLHGLEIQQYPSHRTTLSFICANSIDDSLLVLSKWIEAVRDQYEHIDLESDEHDITQTHDQEHLVQLKQKLFNRTHESLADVYFAIDADVILINSNTLAHLVQMSQTSDYFQVDKEQDFVAVIAPFLECSSSAHLDNNWESVIKQESSKSHIGFPRHDSIRISPVPMIHSAFLVNLHHSPIETLTHELTSHAYSRTVDASIIIVTTTHEGGVKCFLDSTSIFGYFPPPVETDYLNGPGTQAELRLNQEREFFVHLLLQISLNQDERVIPSNHLEQAAHSMLPTPTKLGCDEVYCINLDRRLDRWKKMEYFFDQLGISARRVTAVDGKSLTMEDISKLGIRQLEGYLDPYHQRPLKFGEIGCFLSHYNLWQDMLERGYNQVLILEDDVRFAPGFVRMLAEVEAAADTYRPDWDLIYVGRKKMSSEEEYVPGTEKLVYPGYTYWTLGYVLRRSGAEKLVAPEPLKKMVALDEYISIMFDHHPNETWYSRFHPRNLVALSAEPLLMEPQWFVNHNSYISDTEDSEILNSS